MGTDNMDVYRRYGELQRENAALKATITEQDKRIDDLKGQLEQANALAREAIAALGKLASKKGGNKK